MAESMDREAIEVLTAALPGKMCGQCPDSGACDKKGILVMPHGEDMSVPKPLSRENCPVRVFAKCDRGHGITLGGAFVSSAAASQGR